MVNTKYPGRASYEVITDCHHEDYSKASLDKSFLEIPELHDLTEGYITLNRIHMDQVIDCHPKLTFVAVVEGFCQSGGAPLFIPVENGKWVRCGSTEKDQKLLLTRDYLDYLRREHDFKVTKISKVYFYRKCNLLSEVYDSLVRERQTATSPSLVQIIKSVLNLSCGYFGCNPNKRHHPLSIRIVSSCGWKYQMDRTSMEIGGQVGNQKFFIRKLYRKENVNKLRTTNTPLPLYVMVVEYGKMRMAQHLSFLDKYIGKSMYRHLYSNTDNAVIALGAESLEEAVAPHLLEEYNIIKSLFISSDAGNLKTEWCLESDSNWKFASAGLHNYAVVAENPVSSVHKNSILSNVSAQKSYEMACHMLEKKMFTCEQERRVDKLLNTDTKIITVNLNKE